MAAMFSPKDILVTVLSVDNGEQIGHPRLVRFELPDLQNIEARIRIQFSNIEGTDISLEAILKITEKKKEVNFLSSSDDVEKVWNDPRLCKLIATCRRKPNEVVPGQSPPDNASITTAGDLVSGSSATNAPFTMPPLDVGELAGKPVKNPVSENKLGRKTWTSEEKSGAAAARPSTSEVATNDDAPSSKLEVTRKSSDASPTCCIKRHCDICRQLNKRGFIIKHNGDAPRKGFETPRTVCCQDKNLIYCITCQLKSCGMQYVGKTVNTIRVRFKKHFGNIRKKNMKDGPIGEHFNSAGHHGVGDVEISILEFITKGEKQSIYGREIFWMSKLNTFSPNGLNYQKMQAD